MDWDYLEWFLDQTKFHRIPEWVLPTAQAGLARRCKAKVVPPNNQFISQCTIGKETLGYTFLVPTGMNGDPRSRTTQEKCQQRSPQSKLPSNDAFQEA